ncbi:MAG TPA: hypothetical protein VIG69_12145, partial [Candidatus Methylomirabilis sp.]
MRLSTCVWLTLSLVSGPLRGVSASGEPAPPAPAPGVVLVAGDRLTVQLGGVPLPLVLQQLARQAGLRVAGSDAAGGVLVSDSFRDLPLAEGLQRLLGGQPHVLVSARAPAAPGAPARWRISEVILFAKAPPPAEPAGDPGIPALEAPDPQVRIQALEAWAQQHPR